MNSNRPRNWLALAAFSVFAGFGVTYAWQVRRVEAPQQSSNPADVLGGWLRLMPPEIEQLRKVDRNFATERTELETALAAERERLAAMFESSSAEDAQILEQVERTISAHDALERRVAKYLLAVRDQLSEEQKSRLFAHCADTVREAGGYRWRHGQSDTENQRRRGGGPPPDRGFGRGRGRGAGAQPEAPVPDHTQPSTRPKGDKP
ncbi:MAG: periplasmic heavy metal sensor [Planctomycetes bacterium]|nr:periplasmic heavy metal sensor [Planctomycetota bacterium]